ncbi:MAG TPA: hypothetical protein VLA16_14305, partial [Ideonella sp.]|nr:hypothetical protein [Ideonella sp.]
FRFRCYVDPLGTSRFVAVPGDAVIQVVAGPAARLLVNGPRYLRRGTPGSLRVTLQDRWGNAASDTPTRLHYRWFRSEGGAETTVDEGELAMPAEGWATLALAAPAHASGSLGVALSCPDLPGVPPALAWLTIADALPAPRAFYADLHVHAHDTVGTNSPAYNAAYARDIGGVDVLGYTANDFQITDQNWQLGTEAVNRFNEPGRFVAYPVQEWCGSSTAGGDHNVVFLSDAPPGFPYNARGEHNRTLQWNEDMKGTAVDLGRWPVEELWAAYVDDPANHLIVPHVGGRRYIPDWHHPELERLVEIASSWGHFGWLYQDVISRGYQLGVAASGDEHRGRPGGGPPGVQVFGVRGGLTGVIADRLDRATIGAALRARRTWATTGEHTALLVRCGEHLQGEEFEHRGPARIDYHFLGQTGWDELAAYDHTGLIWQRDLHREAGYSDRRVRLRWGGARIRDRYRWAAWHGTLRIVNGTIHNFKALGFEHDEAAVWRSGATDVVFRSDTYGDADSVEIELSNLAQCRFIVEGRIDSYVKVGDPRKPNPYAHAPSFRWEVSGAELMAAGGLRHELGGSELFLALERLSDAPLAHELQGSFEVAPENGPWGYRPVYLTGRQRDDGKVWSSAQFIRFN